MDGVLTDGTIYLTDGGEEIKAFNSRDGHGMKMLKASGVELAIITARESRSVKLRAEDLNITLLYQGEENKLKVLEKNGLIINQVQSSGNTLLHIATERNNLDLLKRLASFNIAINIKNKEGLTALQIGAMKAKDTKILQYLMHIGADKNVKTTFNETVYELASENEILKNKNINITFLK